MKIKTDFITNSSSTCFVLMQRGDLTFDAFIKAVGIEANSTFIDVFKTLFDCCKSDRVERMEDFICGDRWRKDNETIEEYITSVFSKDTWKRIQEAKEKGFEIYMGRLASDETPSECYFCTSAFLIESENFILDGTNDAW